MARCKLCGSPIEWVQSATTGKWYPLDVKMVTLEDREVRNLWRDADSTRVEGPARGQRIHLETCEKSVDNMKLERLRRPAEPKGDSNG